METKFLIIDDITGESYICVNTQFIIAVYPYSGESSNIKSKILLSDGSTVFTASTSNIIRLKLS